MSKKKKITPEPAPLPSIFEVVGTWVCGVICLACVVIILYAMAFFFGTLYAVAEDGYQKANPESQELNYDYYCWPVGTHRC